MSCDPGAPGSLERVSFQASLVGTGPSQRVGTGEAAPPRPEKRDRSPPRFSRQPAPKAFSLLPKSHFPGSQARVSPESGEGGVGARTLFPVNVPTASLGLRPLPPKRSELPSSLRLPAAELRLPETRQLSGLGLPARKGRRTPVERPNHDTPGSWERSGRALPRPQEGFSCLD